MTRLDRRVILAFVAVVLFLGVNFVAIRFSNHELAPFWGASLRFALATGLLFAIVALRRIELPRGGALSGAALFGALGFGLTSALLYWGLIWVPAGMGVIVFATIPLSTLLIASAIGLERLRIRGILGALVAIVGIALIFGDQLTAAVPLAALAAVFAASLAAALSGIVVKAFPKSHPVAANAVAMAVGATMLLVLSFTAGELRALPALAPTWAAVGWLVTSSVAAFVLMVWILSHWTASATSYGAVLSPLVTIAVAAWLAQEAVSFALAAGGALVLAGVYLGALAEPA